MTMASSNRTSLSQVSDWPGEFVRRLAAKGINEPEQVVAIAAAPGGVDSLADELGVSPEEARRLVAQARARLTPEAAAQMERAVPTDKFGLGANPPRSTKDNPHRE
jgi:hypothetical protein